MDFIDADNVTLALPMGVNYLINHGEIEDTRAGPCYVAPGPVLTCLRKPTQRVLFNRHRDANPFFHLVEALWMLAGRNDVASLTKYISEFDKKFAETGGEVHGAYGHRWRRALGFDQLEYVVQRLRRDPGTRQCVLQMWDCQSSNDLKGDWKDRPCNTHVYLRIRSVGGLHYLDLTVPNRSHDIVWGLYGANAVHFSVLQEYLAARIGVSIGNLYFLSNNFHMYAEFYQTVRSRFGESHFYPTDALFDDRYHADKLEPEPMFSEPDFIDDDVQEFFKRHDNPNYVPVRRYSNRWFFHTADRAVLVHDLYKKGEVRRAHTLASTISSPDWATACTEWIARRIARREAKSA